MKKLLVILTITIYYGCVPNFFSEYYESKITPVDRRDLSINKTLRFLEVGETPKIIVSDNLSQDHYSALSKGYRLIGVSAFNAVFTSHEGAIKQAEKVGAVLVLTGIGEKGIKNTTLYIPVETETTSTTEGNIKNKRFTATTRSKETTSQAMNYAIERYDQYAYYYALMNKDKIKVGIIPTDLSQEVKAQIQRNTGISVYVVIEDTPAYMANILVNDIIIELNSEPIINSEDFIKKASNLDIASTGVTLKIIRNNQEKTITF